MKAPTAEALLLPGPAGMLEAVIESPQTAGPPTAFMVVCHPHPQHAGTMHNKVVTTLARTAHALGAPTIRFNFRGVGASAGTFDDGRGETDDALAAVAAGRQRWPGAALWLAGFSFGGIIALRASVRGEAGKVQRLVTIAPALGRAFADPADIALPSCPWLIVQGDADEVIDGQLVIAWAGRLAPPPRLAVLAGVGHYFHGNLAAVQKVVSPFLQAAT
ncbi:MAG TPA: alpha/beta fold hydrolase [Steroidobacteraceae bacterium]|nr:alpha/beta fold hydrolase [Steroidobacteraceae bacterium]